MSFSVLLKKTTENILWQQTASAQGSANHSNLTLPVHSCHIFCGTFLCYLASPSQLHPDLRTPMNVLTKRAFLQVPSSYWSHFAQNIVTCHTSEYSAVSRSDCTPRSHEDIAFPFVYISWTESPFSQGELLLLEQEKPSPTDKYSFHFHTLAGSAGYFHWHGVKKTRCFLPVVPSSLEAPKMWVLQYSQRA